MGPLIEKECQLTNRWHDGHRRAKGSLIPPEMMVNFNGEALSLSLPRVE